MSLKRFLHSSLCFSLALVMGILTPFQQTRAQTCPPGYEYDSRSGRCFESADVLGQRAYLQQCQDDELYPTIEDKERCMRNVANSQSRDELADLEEFNKEFTSSIFGFGQNLDEDSSRQKQQQKRVAIAFAAGILITYLVAGYALGDSKGENFTGGVRRTYEENQSAQGSYGRRYSLCKAPSVGLMLSAASVAVLAEVGSYFYYRSRLCGLQKKYSFLIGEAEGAFEICDDPLGDEVRGSDYATRTIASEDVVEQDLNDAQVKAFDFLLQKELAFRQAAYIKTGAYGISAGLFGSAALMASIESVQLIKARTQGGQGDLKFICRYDEEMGKASLQKQKENTKGGGVQGKDLASILPMVLGLSGSILPMIMGGNKSAGINQKDFSPLKKWQQNPTPESKLYAQSIRNSQTLDQALGNYYDFLASMDGRRSSLTLQEYEQLQVEMELESSSLNELKNGLGLSVELLSNSSRPII